LDGWHLSNPKNNSSGISLFCEKIGAVPFFTVRGISAAIDYITLKESFLLYGQHKLLKE
jgi:hypothetical protein